MAEAPDGRSRVAAGMHFGSPPSLPRRTQPTGGAGGGRDHAWAFGGRGGEIYSRWRGV